MNNNKDPMDQIIVDDLLKEAASIDDEIAKAGVEAMPADLKERIKENLHRQMEEQEKERVYAQLSEEDRKALEVGKEMLRKSEGNKESSDVQPESDGKVVYRRKRRKVYVALAAVAVLVLAMGITSIGGAERVIEMMKVAIGGREVVRVDSEGENENCIVTEENEEAAYQEIKDVFGVEAVKLTDWPEGTEFLVAEIDEKLQTVLLKYECDGEIIDYHISSQFTSGSWGIDVENEITDHYYIELNEAEIEIQEYEKPQSKEKAYSAKYSYRGLEYFLMGSMEKTDFEVLVKNLRFF